MTTRVRVYDHPKMPIFESTNNECCPACEMAGEAFRKHPTMPVGMSCDIELLDEWNDGDGHVFAKGEIRRVLLVDADGPIFMCKTIPKKVADDSLKIIRQKRN